MLTKEEFIQQYRAYSDVELYRMLQQSAGYSDEALAALHEVVEAKGGKDRLLQSIEAQTKYAAETRRIEKEITQLIKDGFDEIYIRQAISSQILSDDQLGQFISKQYHQSAAVVEDQTVDATTIRKCVGAGIIAALVSGTLLGLVFIFTGAIQALLLVGVGILCYAIVKAIVKKSRNNTAVFLTSFIATVAGIFISILLYRWIGPRL